MALDGYLTFGTKIDERGIEDGLKNIEKTAEKTAGGFTVGKGIVSNLAADAIKAAGGALADAAKTGMDFEASMSRVSAVSGATGDQLQKLTDTAREYGASTVFSSSECADALNYMAMAGWSAEQMTNGLPGVLNLAAAAGEDLGTTSDIVTDALTAFGMQAEDSAHFADILATASSKSNTNVSMMGETFKYVAPVAGALGYSAEDVAVAVGLMANNGIKASQAGTSLRTMLSNLTEPTDKQAEAMKSLGVSLTDSEGNMKSLDTLLGDMRSSFSKLDESSKASYASILAGSEGMSGLLAIVNASTSDFDNLKSSIYDCDGACDTMAATMTDNVSGGLKELSSAAEDAKIEIYDAVKPMISDALPGIKDIFGWLKSNAGNIANLLKPIGGALQVVFALLKPIGALLSPILNLVGKFTGAIGDIASTLASSTSKVEDYNGTMKECSAEIESTSKALQQAKEEFGENSDEVQQLQRDLDTLNAQYRKGGGDAAIYSEKIQEISESLDELKSSQDEAMNAIDDSEVSGLRAVSMLETLSGKTQLTSADLDTMSKYADYLNDTFDCDIKVNYDTGQLTGFNPDAIVKQIQDKVNSNRQQSAIDFITGSEFTDDYIEAAETYYSEQEKLRNLQTEFDRIAATKHYDFNGNVVYANTERYHELEEQIAATTKSIEENKGLIETHNEVLDEYAEKAGWDAETTQLYKDSLMDAANSGSEFISIEEEANSKLSEQEHGVQAAKSVIDEYHDRIEGIAQAYDDAYEAAYTSFSGQFGLFDEAKMNSEATIGAAKTALDSQLDYWTTYNDNLKKLHSMSAEELGVTQEDLDALMVKLSDGTAESANLVNELANGGKEDIAGLAQQQGEVAKIREDVSKTAAEMRVDVNAEMDKVKEDMKGAIKDLNLDEEAENSAIKTIDGYIDGIKDTMGEARAAAQSVVDAVRAVFNNADLSFSASGVSGSVQIEGNARGTTNSSDVFVAGENGPELIVGKGGSTVFPFSETAKIVNAVSGLLPNFSTNGIYSSLAAPQLSPSMLSGIGGMSSASAQPISQPQSTAPPSVYVYIGDEEIRSFVVETITDANANTGGWSA